MSDKSKVFSTSREIAKLLRVSPEKVLGWIRRGQLKAINIGNGFRPQYRISPDALQAFFAGSRSSAASPSYTSKARARGRTN